MDGRPVCGEEEFTDEQLAAHRENLPQDLLEHRFDDAFYADRSARFADVEVPLLTTANWGGQGLHERGTLDGYLQSSSTQKWLEVHGGEHWTAFYTDYGRGLQRRFFDWFLKDREGDWDQQPPVLLDVRHPGKRFVTRPENEWPLARTDWRRLHLHVDDKSLSFDGPATEQNSATYAALGEGLTLLTAPFEADMEITGPLAARLWVSSSTTDADLFLVLRVFDPDHNEVLFHGAHEPRAPISLGWLRASHRKLDPERSLPWQPHHPHQEEEEPLVPGQVYPLDIEIWPTCIVIPSGYRLGLSILGRDYDNGLPGMPSHLGADSRGVGPFRHNDPTQRPAEIYGGDVTVYSGGDRESYLLVPVIPA